MPRRSEKGPLAALEWLDDSGLFVPPVSLRDWNEVPRQMEVCGRLTTGFRDDVAVYVREHRGHDAVEDRDEVLAENAIRRLLGARVGAPPVVAVDVLEADPAAVDWNIPDMVMMDFEFPGGRRRSPSAISDRMRTPPVQVEKFARRLHDSFIDSDEKNPMERFAAESNLDAMALLRAQEVEDVKPRAGRIGYVELVPDVDWPEWKAVSGAEEVLAAVEELWPARCRDYQELAAELTARHLRTLSGKSFTKASVVKVLIAARLVSGSHPPWK